MTPQDDPGRAFEHALDDPHQEPLHLVLRRLAREEQRQHRRRGGALDTAATHRRVLILLGHPRVDLRALYALRQLGAWTPPAGDEEDQTPPGRLSRLWQHLRGPALKAERQETRVHEDRLLRLALNRAGELQGERRG